jgi:hypothetical protein
MKTHPKPSITLTTDFGLKDHYVAAMKGVILGLCPDAQIIDISHMITRHAIREAAYVLSQSSPYFPEGTIHVVVVDPGVGTRRRRLAIRGGRGYFVGPDNGVLMPAARREGIVKIVEVVNREMMLPSISSTFEGRDVFAPVAAHLANGVDIARLGPEVSEPVELSWGEFEATPLRVTGEVLHIDGFGNVVTNIPNSAIEAWRQGSPLRARVGSREESSILSRSYADVPEGWAVVVLGSGGFLEIAVNRGSAGELFAAQVGSRVKLEKAIGDDVRRR